MSDHCHIGRVAREIGLNPPTIRYYERIGLLPPPTRSENGYRLYSQDDLVRLRFVKRARLLDLPLEEIRDIMTYALDGHCGFLQQHLISLLEINIAEVNEPLSSARRGPSFTLSNWRTVWLPTSLRPCAWR